MGKKQKNEKQQPQEQNPKTEVKKVNNETKKEKPQEKPQEKALPKPEVTKAKKSNDVKKEEGKKSPKPTENTNDSKKKNAPKEDKKAKETKIEKKSETASNSQNTKVEKKTEERAKISLFFNPLTTLYYLSFSLRDLWIKLKEFLAKYGIFLLVLLALLIIPRQFDGPHKSFVMRFEEILFFAGWWTLLGVASSIGFGTGLHTFVLYLGPHIAKVTMAANECNAIPNMIPSRWSFKSFDKCPSNVGDPIGFWGILYAVQLEAFFWGFGTAIGELPPYFVARAAALANKKSEEIDEVLKHKDENTFERLKYLIYVNLMKYGFITVLLCASIPNPLFDLAGITCGHFLIPFSTFFSATFIGKAIIKVHIQMIFVIFVFTKHHVESLIAFFEDNLPFLNSNLTNMINNQKKLLFAEASMEDKPLIAKIWDVVIVLMILFFLVSIINSLANQYKEEHEDAQEKAAKNKKKKK